MEFTPRLRSSPPDLAEKSENTHLVTPEPVVGNFFAISATCSEGFKLVKCLSVDSNKFSGQYLDPEKSKYLDKVKFNLSSLVHEFVSEFLIIELLSVTPVTDSTSLQKVFIGKKELDQVLLLVDTDD